MTVRSGEIMMGNGDVIDGKIEKIEVHKQECFSCDIWIAKKNYGGVLQN